ncbi:hypothetical protein [Peribacillus frigoritolerans]|uniref:hypothetical protein n=1 Tax=Peribacillus frigoritolerans TaxID=450367 RepID=UPI002E1B06EB|nr:hypothetical protein [Peribacillus frigoritolerans]MED3848856.1 hypothetical protein [Peribacillus frigoritolerans]
MRKFFHSIAFHPIFTFLAGIASIISLTISYNNEQIFYWIIFALIAIIFLQLLYLINVNSKMVEKTNFLLGKMDVVNFNIFQSRIDLEEDDEGKYISKADVFLVIQSSLTPDNLLKKPIALVQLQYPSQLKMKFDLRNHLIKQKENTNNSCCFEVPLGTGIEFIAIRSIHLKDGDADAFKASSQKIDITITCPSLEQTLFESVQISSVGW